MKYIEIFPSGQKVSQLALGTWVFSGTNWGGTGQEGCMAAVHAALDCGINLIDTAPIYGYGLAETIVGKAIKGRRDKVVLATKCGLSGRGKGIYCDLKPKTIAQEIEGSLKRLQTDHVDIYQCHWPDDHTPIRETLHALLKLKDQAKIRHIGLSNFELSRLKEADGITDIVTLQSPLSILDRGLKDDILPFCHEKNIGVLTYGSLGGGILSGKYNEEKKFPSADARSFFYKFYVGDKFQRIRNFLNKLEDFDLPLNQIALNWARCQPGVASVITGARNAQQVKQNVESIKWDMSFEQLDVIEQLLKEFEL